MAGDPYNLQRFIEAQRNTYRQACEELRRGRKASHWMWFIFPQIAGLGISATSRFYAIGSLSEAIAYLARPVLGARLREVTAIVAATENRTAQEIFGSPDDMKLRSSMTLFAHATEDNEPFAAILRKYFRNQPDPRTLDLLKTS